MQNTEDTGHVKGMIQETENDLDELENQNVNTVRMTYDPTRDNMSQIVLVGERTKDASREKYLRKHGITRMTI